MESFQDKQQKNIHLGQDINNTFQLVAAELGGEQRSAEGYYARFKNLFPAVRRASQWARENVQSIDATEVIKQEMAAAQKELKEERFRKDQEHLRDCQNEACPMCDAIDRLDAEERDSQEAERLQKEHDDEQQRELEQASREASHDSESGPHR